MQALLYANDGESSLKNSQTPSLCLENRLNLLPEHIAQIGSAFIFQLSISTLRSQDVRILSTIYHQTIDYNKREDDMNGKRLEQLTGIRSDHANEAVCRLQALNIIITRPGHYGKWMSINFDFAHWGEKLSKLHTNDPSCLLSDLYSSTLLPDDLEFRVHSISDSSKVVPMSDTISYVSTSKDQQQTPPATLKSPIQEKDHSESSKSSSETSVPFEPHFPDFFSEKLRNSLLDQLKSIKIPQEAQRLLDYFAKRLIESNIRNPIAYFIALKNRLLKGQLDLRNDNGVIEEKKKVNAELKQFQAEYREAVIDQKQLKQHIESMMESKNCTFDKAVRKIGYHNLWETACKRLEKIITILKTYPIPSPNSKCRVNKCNASTISA